MKMDQIPFQITNWQDIPEEKYNGEKSYAIWKTQIFNNIRVRIVEYSPDYLADHAEAHRSSTKTGARLFIVD